MTCIDKATYVLGSELWEENFEDTLRLVVYRYMGDKEAKSLW